MKRWPQVKGLTTVDALRTRLAELVIDGQLPVADAVNPGGVLASSVDVGGGLRSPNRFAILPMEGWDADPDGRPSDLVRRRWSRFGASGCGLVWGEATAVRPDGRANPNQLVLDASTVGAMAELRGLLDPSQVAVLQLTHSGRWSRPTGTAQPRTAYAHPLLDRRAGASAKDVLSDGELDDLAAGFVAAAVLAAEAGFDAVDVKHCHGYLLHELLSAYDRPGPYGGDLAGRTRFLRTVVEGVRSAAPALAIAVRVSVFDLVPFVPGADRVGVAEANGPYAYAFGGDGTGLGVDLAEAHAFIDLLTTLGVGLVATTAGSPYTNPHVQRPAIFPPSDGYLPPEDPLVGVARQVTATAELAAAHPETAIVAGGLSYLQQWLPNAAEAIVSSGGAGLIGLGRMALSYPHLAADVLAGRALDSRLICRTFSDCTTAPRNGLVSGCYPLDPFYKARPERVELVRAKRAMKNDQLS